MMLAANEYRAIVWMRLTRALDDEKVPATGVSACRRTPVIRSLPGVKPSGRPVTWTHCMPK